MSLRDTIGHPTELLPVKEVFDLTRCPPAEEVDNLDSIDVDEVTSNLDGSLRRKLTVETGVQSKRSTQNETRRW